MSNETLKAAFFPQKKNLFYHNSPFSWGVFYPHESVSLHFLEITIYEAVIGFAVNTLVLCFYPLLLLHYESWDFRLSVFVSVHVKKPNSPGKNTQRATGEGHA